MPVIPPPRGISGITDLRNPSSVVMGLVQKLLGGVTWEALAFTAAWGNLGGNQVAQVGTDTAGKVYIRGIVKSVIAYAFPATNTVIGILPEGKRPKENQFAGVAWQRDTTNAFAVIPIVVTTAGSIQLTFGNSDFMGATNGNAAYLAIPELVFTAN